MTAGILKAEDVTKEKLQAFLSDYGRAFYGVSDERNERIVLRKSGISIEKSIRSEDGAVEVIPFRRGKLTWEVQWT